MTYVRDLLNEGDLCVLAIVVFGLFYTGRMFVQDKPQLRRWGGRLAAITFIGFGMLRLLETPRPMADDILAALFVGAAGAGLIIGPVWMVMGVLAFGFDYLQRAHQALKQRRERRKYTRNAARREREQAQQRRDLAKEERRLRPIRDQQRQEDERRRQDIERRQSEETRRKSILRLECQLLYDRNSIELQRFLSRERADEYAQAYLSDNHSLEAVEEAASLFRDMIRDAIAESTAGRTDTPSIGDLSERFRRQREEVRAMDADNETKESLLSILMQQERVAVRELLSR